MRNVVHAVSWAMRADIVSEDFVETTEPVFTGKGGREYSLAQLMLGLQEFYFAGWAYEEWVRGFFTVRYGLDAYGVIAIAEASGKIAREWRSGTRVMLSWPLGPRKAMDSIP